MILVTLLVAGGLAPIIAPNGWNSINIEPGGPHQPPALHHLFGTDGIGRDMLVRTIYGIRTTEEVALAAAVTATVAGLLAGALAAYYKGWLDAVTMRLADLVTAFPAVVLLLAALVYLREAYPHNLILIFACIMWAVIARVVRAQVGMIAAAEHVEASKALGASDTHVLLRHVLPNVAGTALVAGTSLIGQIILIDSTVEFFNYGLSSSISPSLGNLVADAVQLKFGQSSQIIAASYGWWTWVFPALALTLILVCINLLGDAMDTAFNPTVNV